MLFSRTWMAAITAAFALAIASPGWAADVRADTDEDKVEVEVDTSEDATPAEEPDEGAMEDIIPDPGLRLSGPDALDNIVVEAGGGMSTFTGDLGEALEGGASLTARGVVGVRSLIGVELAYTATINTSENVDNGIDLGIGGEIDGDGTTYGNSFDALARVNFLDEKSPVKPFVAGGVGYTRFDSDIGAFDNDHVFSIPLAVGVQVFPWEALTVGARAEYKILSELRETVDGDQWGGALTVGANF